MLCCPHTTCWLRDLGKLLFPLGVSPSLVETVIKPPTWLGGLAEPTQSLLRCLGRWWSPQKCWLLAGWVWPPHSFCRTHWGLSPCYGWKTRIQPFLSSLSAPFPPQPHHPPCSTPRAWGQQSLEPCHVGSRLPLSPGHHPSLQTLCGHVQILSHISSLEVSPSSHQQFQGCTGDLIESARAFSSLTPHAISETL